MEKIGVPADLRDRLRCPACGAPLALDPAAATCARGCRRYPVHDGVPLLVDESTCPVPLDEILRSANAFTRSRSRAEVWAKHLVPSPHANVTGARMRALFRDLLPREAGEPTVLLVGNGQDDAGLRALGTTRVVNSDLFLYPSTNLVCDALRIPFADGTFDGVTAIAVLEHVLEPERAVAEIHRVLRPGGIVLAETPFMQQVHGGPFDFTRFTDLGHRRLFRRFEEIERGACGGPGMALAWAYHYFLLSLVGGPPPLRRAVTAFAYATSFWLRFFDRLLIARPETSDAASGLFFLGRRSEATLDDRQLVRDYRGAVP
jgi:SAM-dependent methyltransferase